MLGIVQEHVRKYNWILLRKMIDLRGDSWVHNQRANFFQHWHSLVFLDITCWDRMNNDFGINVLDTWLETRSTHVRDLDEFILVARYVVPSAVQGHWHSSIIPCFKSRWGYHNICMHGIRVSGTTMHQCEVEAGFVESTLIQVSLKR